MLAAISYDPLVHIEVGPLSISPHGIGIALGFLVGARLMLPEARRKGLAEDDVLACVTRAAIGSLIGARLAYVVNHPGDYDSVLDVLKVWQGGISLLGGFFGGILLAIPAMRKRRMSFWKLMDASAPGMALGVVVGRVGDLVVGDHLGKPTSFFLGYRCPPQDVETASPCLGAVVHQTALYDLLLTAVLLGALLLLRRRPRYDGFLIMVFGAWYGGQRIFEDFLREDVRRFGLTGSQIASTVTVLVCLNWLLFHRRTPRWGRWDALPGDTADEEAGTADADVAEATEGEVDQLVPSEPERGQPRPRQPSGRPRPLRAGPTMAPSPEQRREE